MLGCVVDLEFLANVPGFLRFKRLVERGEIVRIQVIQHEHDFLGVWVIHINEVVQYVSKILLGAMGTHCHMPPAPEWFKAHEQATDSLSLIFVVRALNLSRLSRERHTCFADQLLARFIQADGKLTEGWTDFALKGGNVI